MAKKKTNNKESNKTKSSKKDKSKKSLIPNEISWIMRIFLMIFITLSIFSHNYLDSSFNRISEEAVKNYFGIVGSYFSDIIFQLFGVVSYIIPVFFPIYYIKKQFFRKQEISVIFTIQVIISLIIISSLITIYPIYEYEGGIIGSLVTISLTSVLNNVGSTLFLSFMLFALSILMYEIPLKKLSLVFMYSVFNLFMGLFSLLRNHLKELKNDTSINENKEENNNKDKKNSQKANKKKEKIIEDYDTIKMEKLKIKEEIRLEKERLKLEKIKKKQEEKRRREEEAKAKKISKEEEKIIEDIFSDNTTCSRDESVTHPTTKQESDTENESSTKNEFFSEKGTPTNKEKTSKANKDKLISNSTTSQSHEEPTEEPKGFVMYSKIKNINDNDIIENDTNNETIVVTPPPPPNEDKLANHHNAQPSVNPEDSNKDNEISSSIVPEPISTNIQKTNDEIEIKVAKKTNIDNFDNFGIITDKNEETNYKLPPIEYLKFEEATGDIDQNYLMENARLIVECLADFNIIDAKIKEIFQGPTLTTYELEIKRGIQISKVIKYTDEIAAMLKVSGVRMISIPQKGVIGVEVPNKKREIVWLKEIIASEEYQKEAKKSKLTVVLGKDISGEPIIANLAKMPHLLIAGTTGSGKSVFNNVLITSILYNSTPDEVKFILIDPKMLEFSLYNDIPNLLFPVIIDPKKAAHALNWAVDEMERRYKLIADNSERDIVSYNDKMKRFKEEGPSQDILDKIQELETLKEEIENDESISQDEKDREARQVSFRIAEIKVKYSNPEILPYIVVVLDEYADLMMVAGKNVEISISRIAQKARAAGIHLVIATQRPDKDVVTGIIKANLPVRVALSVKGSTNSKIILDSTGAEKLLGHGDLLYLGPGTSNIKRIQSPLVTSDEQKRVLDFLREQGKPTYTLELLNQYDEGDDEITEVSDDDKDVKYDEAVKIAIEMKKISASYLQRRLKLGYNRAARIVEVMEKEGIVGPPNGSKPRKVMISEY